MRSRVRGAAHGRCVEAEVRAILTAAVSVPDKNFLLALTWTAYLAAQYLNGVRFPAEGLPRLPSRTPRWTSASLG